MNPRELLVSNLALIDRAIAYVCRRNHLDDAQAEEFAAIVRLKLVENDYAILRKFEGRSQLATFITVVIQRLLLDHRIHLLGKWHASAEAKRHGADAIALERLLRRDGRSVEEALALMPHLTRPAIEDLASKLPPARVRPREVTLEEAEHVADPAASRFASPAAEASQVISRAVRQCLETLPAEDRLILKLRFQNGMSAVNIARSMGVDQKQLYRRLERHLRALRAALEEAGIDSRDAASLLDNPDHRLEFGLEERAS